MTPLNLLNSLSNEIKTVLKDYELQAEYQRNKSITVYKQHFSMTHFTDDTYYPNVVIYLDNLQDDIDSIATVVFSIGIYGDENESGWVDLFNISERIRQFLLTNPIIDGQFLLVRPLVFQPANVADQPEPFFFGSIVANYRVATPRVNV